jgi:hypothetical protein
MKTNYKIGETYYWNGRPYFLRAITKDIDYPLELVNEKSGLIEVFTLGGKYYTSNKNPSLSTSPTEFIAPKEEKDYEYYKTRWGLDYNHMIKIKQAITLLKSEGYTITKQY